MDRNNQAQTGAKDFCNSFCHSCSLFLYYGKAASAIDIQLVPSLVHSYLRIGVELES